MNNDWDRDRHEHNGRWFERVAPHSPHYVQCLPDGVPTFEPVQDTAMHWLPMSEDAVFEDGEKVLGKTKDGEYVSLLFDARNTNGGFDVPAANSGCSYCDSVDQYYFRYELTHYARITEPK